MIRDIISRLNWVDLVIFVLFLRGIYIGLRNGFSAEIFKIIGILLGSILSLQYYSSLAGLANSKIDFSKELMEFNAYLVILFACIIIFALLRDVFLRFIKIEAVASLNKWGGLIFGFLRAFLVCSALLFSFLILNNQYLKDSLDKSYFASRITKTNLQIYKLIWPSAVNKFFPEEEINKAVFELN